MNWDAVGAIAELLGAIGVIASLVYLATQIRQSREQMGRTLGPCAPAPIRTFIATCEKPTRFDRGWDRS